MNAIDKRTGRPYGDHGTALQAIQFATDYPRCEEADTFLKHWLEGDLDEWPKFYEWLAKQPVEAALSTDAEPVAWAWKGPKGGFLADDKKPSWPSTPLYAEPVKTAPTVAVKALQAAQEELSRIDCIPMVTETSDTYAQLELAKVYAARGAHEARKALAALSAQVQDVARCLDCDGYNCDDGCAYPDPAPVAQVQDVAGSSTDMKALQSWVYQQRVSLQTNDPEYFAKYGVWKAVGAQIRLMLSASPAPKHGEEG